MWEELGFYEGFALMWRSIQESKGGKDEWVFRIISCTSTMSDCIHLIYPCSRISHNIRHLLELIAQFPRVNPSVTDASDLDIPKLFRQIRSRYKALCATLGVKPTLRAAGSSPEQEAAQDSGKTSVTSDEGNTLWKIDDTTRVSAPPKDYSF